MCCFSAVGEGIMAAPTHRTIGLLVVPVVILGLAQGAVGSEAPTQLASVSVPVQPNSLAWSADGSYLAAGTWGYSTTGEARPCEVYVVDVANASVVTTLKVTNAASGLAFSPDGKWLAVGQRSSFLDTGMPAELVVFDVPAFTARFTAKVGSPENCFVELAWAADSKSLLAIDGPVNNGKAEVRRWDVPDFTEQPVVRSVQLQGDAALAVSPDGHTLALSFGEGVVQKPLVQLFDPDKGGERSIRPGNSFSPPRLGFTADGKSVGVFDTNKMLWWDVATGRRADPRKARFAVQPAGLSDIRSRSALSPDGAWVAHGYEQHPGLGHLSLFEDEPKYGGFVRLTHSETGKSRTWRVSRAQYPPAVAFSPEGTKLAGTICQPIRPGSKPGSDTGLILFWAVPR
jgi:WD40 repeat protein